MRAVIQRVKSASVQIKGGKTEQIGQGLMLLLGVRASDTPQESSYLSKKTVELRIFEDEEGKLNRSLLDIGGELLVVSNFTLYADCKKGRRPSFVAAARPETAVPLYEQFVSELRGFGVTVKTGEFGADMQVEIHNDGPVTILLDTDEIMPKQGEIR